ncbi:hypothetical protein B0T17DRAFT_78425 [Bombardia bombarda]|uniref:Uncharacterized protein n=1 Tax=Bombardia bombarda TaxID=252184 RepID=A0AA39XMF9_9PEZI|nr:hypothetical protein B0T17DRAFT_78425 [Bombardia bombarda]
MEKLLKGKSAQWSDRDLTDTFCACLARLGLGFLGYMMRSPIGVRQRVLKEYYTLLIPPSSRDMADTSVLFMYRGCMNTVSAMRSPSHCKLYNEQDAHGNAAWRAAIALVASTSATQTEMIDIHDSNEDDDPTVDDKLAVGMDPLPYWTLRTLGWVFWDTEKLLALGIVDTVPTNEVQGTSLPGVRTDKGDTYVISDDIRKNEAPARLSSTISFFDELAETTRKLGGNRSLGLDECPWTVQPGLSPPPPRLVTANKFVSLLEEAKKYQLDVVFTKDTHALPKPSKDAVSLGDGVGRSD